MDLATGRLGPGAGPQGGVRMTFERHPDTGGTIAGREVPHWRDAIALCTLAFDMARGFMSIGWDVAITDDGPVLLEANSSSNPGIAQAPSGVPPSDTPYPAAILAGVQRTYRRR